MKYNKWIDNISRLFIPRPSVVENKRFDMAERISNFEDEFFIRFKMAALNQEDFITFPSPDAMIGVPIGAAKSVPLCILLKPRIGCFLIPKLEDNLAPLIGVFIKVFFTL